MGKNTPTVLLENQIVEVLGKTDRPLSAHSIMNAVANQFNVHYSQQHVKRTVNGLVTDGRIEFKGKDRRTELFSLPGKELEPWVSSLTVESQTTLTIRLPTGVNYSPQQLAILFSQASWSPLNDVANREIRNMLTLLMLGNSVDDLLMNHGISQANDLREPLEDFANNFKMLSEVITTVLTNQSIKNRSVGNHISNETRAELLEQLDKWLTELAINKRSVQANGNER